MKTLSAKDIKDTCSLKFESIDELIKDEMAMEQIILLRLILAPK